jgi:hypothetical protein
MTEQIDVVNPEDHKAINQMFQFAFATQNPLILQSAEKWAGVSGYRMNKIELEKYAQVKDQIKQDECKFPPLLIELTNYRLE